MKKRNTNTANSEYSNVCLIIEQSIIRLQPYTTVQPSSKRLQSTLATKPPATLLIIRTVTQNNGKPTLYEIQTPYFTYIGLLKATFE